MIAAKLGLVITLNRKIGCLFDTLKTSKPCCVNFGHRSLYEHVSDRLRFGNEIIKEPTAKATAKICL